MPTILIIILHVIFIQVFFLHVIPAVSSGRNERVSSPIEFEHNVTAHSIDHRNPSSDRQTSESIRYHDYWTAVQKQDKERSRKARLFVEASPKEARVRILNIGPKFEQGIILRPGRYHIEVSAKGYKKEKQWITIEKGEIKTLQITLDESTPPKKSPVHGLFRIHKVKTGETLWSISTKYGVSLFILMQVNTLSAPNIYIGQELLIPLKPILEEDVRAERKEEARKLLELGHAHRNRGEFKQAIAYYNQALEANPYYSKAYYSIGFAYLKLNLQKEAIDSFKRAVDINPYNPEAYYNLGLSYFIIGSKDSAFECYEILKTLDSQLAEKLRSYIENM